MKNKTKSGSGRYKLAYIILAAAVLLLLAANICIGTVNIPLGDVFDILMARFWGYIGKISVFQGNGHGIFSERFAVWSAGILSEEASVFEDIVMDIRFPRALAAAILGGGLALSGYLLQTFFHNPIAGPFILGISSGAKLLVAMIMVFSLSLNMKITSMTMIVGAFAGAMVSMSFVLLMSRLMNNMSMLIVSGVMIGYICSAVTDFVVTFADDAQIVNLHDWSKGSFSGITWDNVQVMAAVILISLVCVFMMSKPISAYQMGESYARNMGLNINLFRALLVLLSSILSACVTAFAGPVSFVGIAVPHLVKNLLNTARPILMIPACFLGGAAFCLFCDLLARVLFAPTELSISTVTAVFGAPVVIYIMIRRRVQR